jgi:hypothetical protein
MYVIVGRIKLVYELPQVRCLSLKALPLALACVPTTLCQFVLLVSLNNMSDPSPAALIQLERMKVQVMVLQSYRHTLHRLRTKEAELHAAVFRKLDQADEIWYERTFQYNFPVFGLRSICLI